VRSANSEISIPTIEGNYTLTLGTGSTAPWYFANSPVAAQGRATCVRYEYSVPYKAVTYTHYPIRDRYSNPVTYYNPYTSTAYVGMRVGFHMDMDETFVMAWEYRGVFTDPKTPGGAGKYALSFEGQVYITPSRPPESRINLCGSSGSVDFPMGCSREGDSLRPTAMFVLSVS
jgi:hypothetical protein